MINVICTLDPDRGLWEIKFPTINKEESNLVNRRHFNNLLRALGVAYKQYTYRYHASQLAKEHSNG